MRVISQAVTYAYHQNDSGSPESGIIDTVISPNVLNFLYDTALSSGVSVELHVTVVPYSSNTFFQYPGQLVLYPHLHDNVAIYGHLDTPSVCTLPSCE